MRNQVAHHLERARIAARLTIIGTVTEVAPAIEALRRTMEKIHRDRDIAITVETDPQAKFRGERQDLEEMAGNLMTMPANGQPRRCLLKSWWSRQRKWAPDRCCGYSLTTTGVGCRRPSVSRPPAAVSGWMNRSPARGWGFRSWSISRRCTAEASPWAAHQSEVCGPNWCCPGSSRCLTRAGLATAAGVGGVPKRVLNVAASIITIGWFCRPPTQHPYRAHEPNINRAAKGLSRTASAAVAGAADAGVRARHRTRRGYHGRHLRVGTIAKPRARNRRGGGAASRRSGAAIIPPARAVSH